jgi:ribose 5-phosphate isomerase B
VIQFLHASGNRVIDFRQGTFQELEFMKIAIGADKLGYELKESVKSHLQKLGIEVEDYGVDSVEGEEPYYQIASAVAKKVGSGEFTRAILVCGTGMGMAIIANKHPGVYAAVCENPFAAEKSRSINDSNVLTLGGMITKPEAANDIVDVWLETKFTSGWEPPIVDWLQNSKEDIRKIEKERFGRKG